MPHSLRAKLSGLRYKGILEDKDYKRLCKALDNENVLDKIRAEIEQRPYGVANDSVIQGIKYERMVVLEIIDKYRTEGSNKDTDKGNDCNSCKYQKEVDGSNCYECVKGMRNNYTAESEG